MVVAADSDRDTRSARIVDLLLEQPVDERREMALEVAAYEVLGIADSVRMPLRRREQKEAGGLDRAAAKHDGARTDRHAASLVARLPHERNPSHMAPATRSDIERGGGRQGRAPAVFQGGGDEGVLRAVLGVPGTAEPDARAALVTGSASIPHNGIDQQG